MKLNYLKILNYKSLSEVEFSPLDLATIIGPNNSGKSNFASAVRFLSDVYQFDLENAVKRNGGYENIAFRKIKRTRSAIGFHIKFTLDSIDLYDIDLTNTSKYKITTLFNKYCIDNNFGLLIDHSFSFKAAGQNIKSEFKIIDECFKISFVKENDNIDVFNITNRKNGIKYSINENVPFSIELSLLKSIIEEYSKNGFLINSQQLIAISPSFDIFFPMKQVVRSWAVYKLEALSVRKEGVPTPNPDLNHDGENLPALVDWLNNNRPELWGQVVSTMSIIIPGLKDITVGYQYNKTLGISFQEEGYGRAWNVHEISDGTIMTLSLLCALVDPRKTLILIEEPENSIHPWILRHIVDFFKKVSKSKTVLITTHSPILVDMLYPDQIWVINRTIEGSTLDKLTQLDENLQQGWEDGNFKISEYLDTGIIAKVVPEL